MKLKLLFENIPGVEFKGSKEVEITGLCNHSKMIRPRDLFIAKRGKSFDGTKLIPEAVASGAIAVLTDLFDPFLQNVVQVIHEKPEEIESEIAEKFYGFSNEELFKIALTGTNGKTTTSFLISHLLEQLEVPCGVMGTVGVFMGEKFYPSNLTSHDVVTNFKMLKEMRDKGMKAVAMEVSSHALEQKRVKGISFDAAIFTNLTQDHLDYHETMEKYAEAKRKLFISLRSKGMAIVNADSDWSEFMVQRTLAKVVRFGIENQAEIKAKNLHVTARGTQMLICYGTEELVFNSPLIGKYNVYNLLAAVAVCTGKGFSLKEIAPLVENFKQVPGRLEKIPNKLGIHIFVDYAHTDDALKNVLLTLSEIKERKLITLFGCGGGRDSGKRPLMGKVAENFSDELIITSDNPRNENPDEIVKQILSGISNLEKSRVILDRKEAIFHAVKVAKKGDIILIAGKGHEKQQIFHDRIIPFDDKAVAGQACEETH